MDMKKILIVVDMQNDFIDGALGTKVNIPVRRSRPSGGG